MITESTVTENDTNILSINEKAHAKHNSNKNVNNYLNKSMINNMADYLRVTAEKTPRAIAFKCGNSAFTFEQLNRYSDNLAGLFYQRGLKSGDRVVCCTGNTWQSVVCFWAVLKAGGVISLVAHDMSLKSLKYILSDSGAKFLVTSFVDAKNINIDPVNIVEELLAIESLSFIISTDQIDGNLPQSILSFERAIEDDISTFINESLDIDLAAIIYTSGSTGEPKGVMLTHRNMITATESLNSYLNYRADDVILSVLPLSFDYGLYQMIMGVSVGATLILEKDFTWPILTIKKIETEKVSILPIVPTIVILLEDCASKMNFDLSSVRLMSNTGAEVNKTHLDIIANRFPNAEMFSMYGLTECKRCSYLSPQDLLTKPGSVGIAIPNTEIWIVDEAGNQLAPEQMGEIVIRGGTVMKGYWKKPEQTAKKLKDGPIPGEKVLHTGDYGIKDKDGYLYFKGRMDEVLKCRGMKVSPLEVEAFLMSIEGVKEAAIVGIHDDVQDYVLHAFVAHEMTVANPVKHIVEHCQQGLLPNQCPSNITLLKQLPKTTNGKVDKKSLRSTAEQS
jgi:acyl-CoA synthetase (AMP-forming)/AMP-acid ligase II